MRSGRLAWLLLLAVAASAAAFGPPPTLERRLTSIIRRQALFWNMSFSFAIANSTSDSIAVAAGYNDYRAGVDRSYLTPATRVPSGSVTKMYTAVAVLRLAEAGTLRLDEPVAPYIDQYLAVQRPCSTAPAWCGGTCGPLQKCASAPTSSGCSEVTPLINANCSYCLRYFHCPTPSCPAGGCYPAPTLRQLWGDDRIEQVTFRQLVSMTSGLKDYYYDKTGCLKNTVLGTGRDVEPLEYLMHMQKDFLFSPGTPNRGAYSTNGFSLVGLALCGLLRLDDWADLDQRQLAWGSMLPSDEDTVFATRGKCSSYANMSHQYYSPDTGTGGGKTSTPHNDRFIDIINTSCLNSWLGGNIALRPQDGARFAHAVFAGGLLGADSLKQMTSLHPITDGFAAGYLAYGMGLEALWNGGKPTVLSDCNGLMLYGHGGLDYGSSSPLLAYIPELGHGLALSVTSGTESGQLAMNCSLGLSSLATAATDTLHALMNEVIASTLPASTPYKCTAPAPTTRADPSQCQDAAYFGKLGGNPISCRDILNSAAGTTRQPVGTLCKTWLGVYTLKTMATVWAPQYKTTYEPPPGYPQDMYVIDLCKGTCGTNGAGPCWLNSKQTPWCQY